jgi:prepilin-type N-terminal cleavage/methylation domain-containing protein
MLKKDHHKKGFTLVELLISMLIVAVLSMTVGLLLKLPFQVLQGNREFTQVKRKMALAMTALSSDIRESEDNVDGNNYGAGMLNLPATAVRGYPVEYKLEGSALNRYKNGSFDMAVVPSGVTLFQSRPVDDAVTGRQGVEIRIEVQSDGGVPIAHTSFFNTRN